MRADLIFKIPVLNLSFNHDESMAMKEKQKVKVKNFYYAKESKEKLLHAEKMHCRNWFAWFTM